MESCPAHRGRTSAPSHPIPGSWLPLGRNANPAGNAAILRDALVALIASAVLTFTLGAFLQLRVDLGLGLVLAEVVCIATRSGGAPC